MTLIPILISLLLAPKVEYIEVPVREYVNESLDEWELFNMAIIMTESMFDSDAVGSCEDRGLYQIPPIFVAEVNRISGKSYTHDDAFNVTKSLEMFSIMNPEHDIEKAIRRHNPGAGEWYARKIKENMDFLRKYETVRNELVN